MPSEAPEAAKDSWANVCIEISIQKFAQEASGTSGAPATLASSSTAIYRTAATLASSDTAIYRTGATLAPLNAQTHYSSLLGATEALKVTAQACSEPQKRFKTAAQATVASSNTLKITAQACSEPQKRLKTADQACFKATVALKIAGRASLLKVTVRRCWSL